MSLLLLRAPAALLSLCAFSGCFLFWERWFTFIDSCHHISHSKDFSSPLGTQEILPPIQRFPQEGVCMTHTFLSNSNLVAPTKREMDSRIKYFRTFSNFNFFYFLLVYIYSNFSLNTSEENIDCCFFFQETLL